MSKQKDGLKRYLVIINKLKGLQRYVPKDELLDYVNRHMEDRDAASIQIRTLQRDFSDIESLFGLSIAYDKTHRGYYIQSEDPWRKDQYEKILLNFELLTSLGEDVNLHSYILAEHHRPVQSDYLSALIRAIKCQHPVEFDYTYIRRPGVTVHKRVTPHYLKEDQHRWYLLAFDEDQVFKTFSVHSIHHLQVDEAVTFKRTKEVNINELFRYSYGIWNQEDLPVEEVVLSYSPLDGRFLKQLPLHHSQTILADNEEEFRISVTLRITNDFVMALLARSTSLTVIQPQHLRDRLCQIYQNAWNRNK